MADELFIKALNYAYFYLKFRPRTEKEVANYLQKKSERFHFEQKIIDQVIQELKEQNLINDQDFIKWFVEQRGSAKPKSRFALTTEMMRLGVDKDLINNYFDNHPLEEDDLAFKALSRRWHQWNDLPHLKRRQKATAFLSRRGFSFEIIRRAIDKVKQ
jgi:regulatory protein